MAHLKEFIQIRVRLRRATKADLSYKNAPKLNQVYYVMNADGSLTGSYVITNETDLKTLNFNYKLDRIYVEETPLNKNVTVEYYK